MDRVIPRYNNGFDYVVQHGKALAANGAAFDSCQRDAVTSGGLQLDHYDAVFWGAGQQMANLLTGAERDALTGFVARGGNLCFSGSHVADVLCGDSAEPSSLSTLLHAVPAEAPGDSARFLSFVPAKGSIFERNQPGWLGDATDLSYFVNATSRLLPDGAGTGVALVCLDAMGGSAAVQYDGSAGGGKVVCFGFPFECMSSAKVRARYMAAVLRFFGPHRQRAGG
jgi:hypothetical protein